MLGYALNTHNSLLKAKIFNCLKIRNLLLKIRFQDTVRTLAIKYNTIFPEIPAKELISPVYLFQKESIPGRRRVSVPIVPG
jgi:hypothetical protein